MQQETEAEDVGVSEDFKRKVSECEKDGIFDGIAAKIDTMIEVEQEERRFKERGFAEELEG